MARAVASAVIGLFSLAAAPLAAQNLVVNPHFDGDVFGWTVFTPPLDIGWNGAFDSNGEVCSGVLGATLASPTPISTLAGQCITGVSELINYDFGIDLLVPLGEPVDGFASFRVDWHSNLSCSAYLSTSSFGSFPPPNDAWVTLSASAVTPPAGANSAAVLLIMGRAAGGGDTFGTIFDDAYFAVTGTYDSLVFADGVESSSTACWSVTVP